MLMMYGERQKNATRKKMSELSFSSQAIKDLSKIADYTLENWGLAQSRKYRDGLNDTLQALLKDQKLGKLASGNATPDLRRFPYESHTIYYLPAESGIFIVRVLGQKMDSERLFM